jgi:hypothetical protein
VAKTPAVPAPNDASPEATPVVPPSKGRPTPSRAEQEAARKRPLVADTKEARARAKSDQAAQREKARAGMAAGDDKYLTARDKGPQRRFARDFVDSGWHIGEFVMPLMIVVIIATFVNIPALAEYAFIVLWGFIVLVIIDMVIVSTRVKRAARRKWGDRMEKGLGWYAAMRTIQMRWMRLPKPKVARGEHPS